MTLYLARGDYSQIEARVNPWLAGATWKLDAFRRYDTILGYDDRGKPVRAGPDLYRVTAAGVLGKRLEDVTADDRQSSGKVPELACGFQGGVGAFQAMAKTYRVKITDAAAQRIVDGWRANNSEIVALWAAIGTAGFECVAAPPGQDFPVNDKLSFRRNDRVMRLRLPSGGSLFYWNPRIALRKMWWGDEKWVVVYRAEDSQTKRWSEFNGYGGLWNENAVQATARDLMAEALNDMESEGLNPVLTVHDEGIGEVEADTPAWAAARVAAIMERPRAWAAGLPVAADASAALRYAKG